MSAGGVLATAFAVLLLVPICCLVVASACGHGPMQSPAQPAAAAAVMPSPHLATPMWDIGPDQCCTGPACPNCAALLPESRDVPGPVLLLAAAAFLLAWLSTGVFRPRARGRTWERCQRAPLRLLVCVSRT